MRPLLLAALLLSTPVSAQEEVESITLLLRKPLVTDQAALTKIAAAAFDVPLAEWNKDGGTHFVVFDRQPAGGEQRKEGETRPDGIAIIKSGSRIAMVSLFETPTFPDPEAASKRYGELRVRKAVREHRAWASVVLRGAAEGKDAVAVANRVACRIAAGLLGDDAVALEFSSEKAFRPVTAGMDAALRAADPLAAVRKLAKVPVIDGEDNDALAAAIATAKKRFPEFAAAFGAKKGDKFFVKCPFTEGENTEHLWIEVSKLADGKVTGRIGNEPVDLKKVKAGQETIRKTADCSDWLIVKDGAMVAGGFTIEALRAQAKQRAGRERKK